MSFLVRLSVEVGDYGIAVVLSNWNAFGKRKWWKVFRLWKESSIFDNIYVVQAFWLGFMVRVGGRVIEKRRHELRKRLPRWRV